MKYFAIHKEFEILRMIVFDNGKCAISSQKT